MVEDLNPLNNFAYSTDDTYLPNILEIPKHPLLKFLENSDEVIAKYLLNG